MKTAPIKVAIAGVAALAMAASLPAPAFAINKTTKNCKYSNPDRLLYIENYDGRHQHCYANGGALENLAIYGVNYIDAGNNRVSIKYIPHAGTWDESEMILEKGGTHVAYPPIHQITRIEIL